MKSFGFYVLFFFLLCISVPFGYGLAVEQHSRDKTMVVKSRKLKDSSFSAASPKHDNKAGAINLEDYRPIDPVPSSKAWVRPGPIQHGTPLMPYIPKPSPPPDG